MGLNFKLILQALSHTLRALPRKLRLCTLAQRKLESEAAAGTIGDGDDATVNQNSVLDNGESETCAAFPARATFISAIEAVEKVRQMFLHNAPTVVFESDATRLLRVFEQRDVNVPPFRIGDGIFRKVAEDGGYERKVTFDCDFILKINVQIQALFTGHNVEFGTHLADDVVDNDQLFADKRTSIFHSGDERHVVKQTAESLILPVAPAD